MIKSDYEHQLMVYCIYRTYFLLGYFMCIYCNTTCIIYMHRCFRTGTPPPPQFYPWDSWLSFWWNSFYMQVGGGYISRLFSISYRIKGIYVKKKNQLLCGSKSGNWVPVLKPCDLYPIGIKKKAGAFYFLYSFKMYMF